MGETQEHQGSGVRPPRLAEYLRGVQRIDSASPAPPQGEAPSMALRRRRFRFGIFASALVVLLLLGSASILLLLLTPVDRAGAPRSFTIDPGESVPEIAVRLEREGIVRSALVFLALLRYEGKTRAVKAGTFMLSPAMTPKRVIEILTQAAPSDRDRSVTIPEGFTASEIAARLEAAGIIGDAESLRSATVHVRPYAFLPQCASASGTESCTTTFRDLEGYLFPDTYRFRKDAAPDEIVAKFLVNFDEKVPESLRQEAEAAGRSLRDVIIVASLIEEEAKHDADRPLIAGILWKRLELGMPLAVDATVLYAKSGGRVETLVSRELSADDLQIESPYNTYRIAGLPPGPIANPGLKSILAALRPEPSPYLYYLNAPDGTTVFSRTLGEHNAAKARYLRSTGTQ